MSDHKATADPGVTRDEFWDLLRTMRSCGYTHDEIANRLNHWPDAPNTIRPGSPWTRENVRQVLMLADEAKRLGDAELDAELLRRGFDVGQLWTEVQRAVRGDQP